MTILWAQAAAEVRLTLRRGESLLLTLGIPVGLLVFFSATKALAPPSDEVSFLVPGLLALAIMSTSMVNLAIATGFEREYKVLKRLGTTPLGRPRLVVAKVVSVSLVEVGQAVVIVATGVVLGWAGATAGGHLHVSTTSALEAAGAAILATGGFAGLGLVMAGRLRADAVLGVANGAWLVMLLLGGMVFPLGSLPSGLRTVAQGLPSSALAQTLRASLGHGPGAPTHAWVVLAVWAVVGPVAAAAAFRWE